MQNNHITKGKHLTYPERLLIEKWKNNEEFSNRKISQLLGKSPQTIHNEVKRGTVDLSYTGGATEYSAEIAQNDYDLKRSAVGATGIWKFEDAKIIKEKIKMKYSPEVISQAPDMPSFKTIYTWIKKGWINGISPKDLIYPRKEKHHAKKIGKAPRKSGVLSIEQRTKEANQRLEIGHFEIDLVILNHQKGQQLLTLTDRKTRYEIIRLIPDKTAQSVNTEMKKLATKFAFKSITADNGSEFMKLDEVMDCPIYFAHPYASYERGSNENANRMIRRWLPKGTKTTTAKAVAKIQGWINHYPRKMFHFKNSEILYHQDNQAKTVFV